MLKEYYDEIEINLIIDNRPEHYAYCKNINEAIETLQYLKGVGRSVIEDAFDRYVFMLDVEKKPLELYKKDIEILKVILGKTEDCYDYKGHKIIVKKEEEENEE